MRIQPNESNRSAVKLGVSRQIAIPKRLHDELALKPGDFLEIERDGTRLILTPKVLVSKQVEARLSESFEDFKSGDAHGPFSTADEVTASLRAKVKKVKQGRPGKGKTSR